MIPILQILYILLIALTLLASASLKTALWGLSCWGSISFTAGAVLAVFIALLLKRGISGKLYRESPSRAGSNPLNLLAVAAVSLLLLWLMRARHELWGERHVIASAVEKGAMLSKSSPLGTFLHWALFRLVNTTLIWNGATTSALMSIIAGIVYAAAVPYAARLLHEGYREEGSLRMISSVFLLSNGFVVLFFGAGGNTPLATLFTLLFILSSLLSMRGRVQPIVPALILILAILSHLSAVYLVPGFIYLLVLGLRSPMRRRRALEAAGAFAACWIAAEIVIAAVSKGPGPAGYMIHLAAGVFKGTGLRAGQNLLGNIPTAVNGLLLTGPASAAAFVLLLTGRVRSTKRENHKRRGEEILLLILSVTAIILYILGAGRLYDGLRWENFAATGPALALYVLWGLRRRIPDPREFHRAAVMLAALGIFHTLPWLLVNLDPAASERRLLQLPLAPGRAEIILGNRAFEVEDYDRASKWFLASVEKDSLGHQAHFGLGEINMKQESYIDAISHYSSAHKAQPENLQYHLQLAEALISQRWYEEATTELEKLTSANPDSVIYWRRLGHARNYGHMYEEAIEAYERALELEPGNQENTRNLTSAIVNRAAQLQENGELENAKKLYSRAIALYPDQWEAFNNLAVMEMELENYEKAHEILQRTLKEHPFISSLNFNMGIVLEKLGKNREALNYLRRSLELDQMRSGARPHIERLERKVKEEGG